MNVRYWSLTSTLALQKLLGALPLSERYCQKEATIPRRAFFSASGRGSPPSSSRKQQRTGSLLFLDFDFKPEIKESLPSRAIRSSSGGSSVLGAPLRRSL